MLKEPGDMHEAHLEAARDEMEVLNIAVEARQEQVCPSWPWLDMIAQTTCG